MKKVTTLLMSALTMIIALTAWANAESFQAPRGVGNPPTVVSIDPSAPVESIDKVVVTFDQEIKCNFMGLADVWLDGEFFNPTTGANVQVDANDATKLVFTFNDKITTKGSYSIDFDMTAYVSSKNGNGNVEVNETIAFTVSGASTPVDPSAKLAMSMASGKDGQEFEDEFINMAIAFEENVKANIQTVKLVNADGVHSYDVALNTNFLSMGMNQVLVMAGNINDPAEGSYTLTIPAAAFESTATGAKNEEMVLHYTLKKKDVVVVPDIDMELLSFQYCKYDPATQSYAAPVELKGGNVNIGSIYENDKFVINTNVNQYLGTVFLDIYQGAIQKDENGYDINPPARSFEINRPWLSEVDRTQKYSDGVFELVVGRDFKMPSDKEFTFQIKGCDSQYQPQASRKYFGTDTKPFQIAVKGDAQPFKYSDVTLVSIEPALDQEIVDENQEFVLTFSAPVTIPANENGEIVSGINVGQGATSGFEKLQKMNAEGTVWMFKPGASYLLQMTAEAAFFLKVKDANGLIVRPEGSEESLEENTRFQLVYDCHLACPAVVITPAAGKIDKLFSFEAVAEDGSTISLGSALDKPYLTTASGYRVAETDMDSEIKYDKNGTDISTLPSTSEPKSVKVSFNLNKEITAPGKYYLHFPFAAFSLGEQFSGASSKTMSVEYTIEGTPVVSGSTIKEGAEVKEISLVGFYVDNEVAFAATDSERTPKIQLRDEESTLGNYDIIIANNNGRSIVMADFNKDGEPLALEPGMNYTLRINANSLVIAGTDMAYPEMKLTLKGAQAPAAPEFVKLTHSVADQAATVAEVAKGKAAVINLTPAKGWKVDKVTLDGKDVTADVKDNVYTTPELAADATVNVDLAYDGIVFDSLNSVDEITDFKLRAWSEGGKLHIAGLEKGMKLDVFTVAGALAGSYEAQDTYVTCEVAQGTYIVVVSDKAGKAQAIKIQNK